MANPNSTKTTAASIRSTYHCMMNRCYDKCHRSYRWYGGKGVCVCMGWRLSKESFFKDMGEKPSKKHTLDRMESSGNYSCGHCEECIASGWTANCKWATWTEQAKNRSNNKFYEMDGRVQTMSDWAMESGIEKTTLSKRLRVNGGDIRKAISIPVERRRLFEINGIKKTRCEWAAHFGLPNNTVINRMKSGMSLEESLGIQSSESVICSTV